MNEHWQPNPGPQIEFFKRGEFEALYGGARGGGKTDAVVVDHVRGIDHPQYRGLILRKTFPELREVIDRCFKYYHPFIATPDGGKIHSKFNAQEHVWTFSTGAKVELGSMHTEESKYRYIGRQFVRISFDQLEQFSKTQYEFMLGQTRTPVPELAKFVGIRSTANPGGVGHAWVKARFIDGKVPYQRYAQKYTLPDRQVVELSSVFIPAKVYDNPAITKNDPLYVARLMSLGKELRKAWLDGDWDVFAGQFFDEFRPDIHGIEPFNIPETWEIYGGMDYGEANPTSYGHYAVSPERKLVRVGEYYSPGVGPDHDRNIHNLINECQWTRDRNGSPRNPKLVYADPSMWITRQHDVGRIKSAAMAMSLPLVKASNDRINGWRTVKRELHWEQNDKGVWITEPGIQYFKGENPEFERTLPSVIYKGEVGDGKPEDAKKGGEDHPADELRYMSMGLYGPAQKKEDPKPEPRKDVHREHARKWQPQEQQQDGNMWDKIRRDIGI